MEVDVEGLETNTTTCDISANSLSQTAHKQCSRVRGIEGGYCTQRHSQTNELNQTTNTRHSATGSPIEMEGYTTTSNRRPSPPPYIHNDNNNNDDQFDGEFVFDDDSDLPTPPPPMIRSNIKDEINLISDDDIKSESVPTSISYTSTYKSSHIQQINQYNKANPIFIGSSDDEQHMNMNVDEIQPDFSTGELTPKYDDSLSISIGNLTITFEEPGSNRNRTVAMNDTNSNAPQYTTCTNAPTPPHTPPPLCESQQILKSWKEKVNPKELTFRGLQNLMTNGYNLKMPRDECITLINMIRNGMKNIIFSSIAIQYEERLIAMVIALLDIMKLREKNYGQWDHMKKPQVLLISPHRHMALEARKMFQAIGTFYSLHIQEIIGGIPMFKCVDALKNGLDVITGTPGKLCDMVNRRIINRHTLKNLIALALDGADELTSSRSMQNQMQQIVRSFPDHRVRVLWLESVSNAHSHQEATQFIRAVDRNISIKNLSDEKKMIDCYEGNNYDDIRDMIHIKKYTRDPHSKVEALSQILRYYNGDKIIIFCNTRNSLRRNYDEFVNGRPLARPRNMFYCIDGDCSNEERQHIIDSFKRRETGVIFCTDLLSNGINEKINIIINMDCPRFNSVTKYIKRAGISTAKNVFVFTIVHAIERRERERYHRYSTVRRERRHENALSVDEQIIDRIVDELNIEIQSYHSFSKQRRRHRSIRGQSILRDHR